METFIVESKEEVIDFMLWVYYSDSVGSVYGDFQNSPDIESWAEFFQLEFPFSDDDDDKEWVPEELVDTFVWGDCSFPSIVSYAFESGFDRTGDYKIRVFDVRPVRSLEDFKESYRVFKKEEQIDYEKYEKYQQMKAAAAKEAQS